MIIILQEEISRIIDKIYTNFKEHCKDRRKYCQKKGVYITVSVSDMKYWNEIEFEI